jgi:hypothetical protein
VVKKGHLGLLLKAIARHMDDDIEALLTKLTSNDDRVHGGLRTSASLDPKIPQECKCSVRWSNTISVMTVGRRQVEMRTDEANKTEHSCTSVDVRIPKGQERHFLLQGVHYHLVGPTTYTQRYDKLFVGGTGGCPLADCQGRFHTRVPIGDDKEQDKSKDKDITETKPIAKSKQTTNKDLGKSASLTESKSSSKS